MQGGSLHDTPEAAVFTEDQRAALGKLLAIARVRSGTTEAILSTTLLGRWSTPFLVGPAGSGKEFICREVARRLGGIPIRRWELGAWITVANRSQHTSPEQIEDFIAAHPAGCVVYLAGADTLAATVDRNHGYYQATMGEIETLLDWTSARPSRLVRRNGTMIQANALVVVSGRFATMWGEKSAGGPAGAEAWRLADHEPLADEAAVARWLEEHSGLPAGLLRRLAPRPLVLRHPDRQEAAAIAARLHQHLPPSLDGIGTEEIADALRSPHGWSAFTEVIEQTLVTCHEELPIERSTGEATPANEFPELPTSRLPELGTSPATEQPSPTLAGTADVPPAEEGVLPTVITPSELPARASKLPRLADRLRWTPFRSRILGKARRLGLPTAMHLESLAVARGYVLSGEEPSAQHVFLPGAWKEQFDDVELAVALLSPSLEYVERAICRGSVMLRQLCMTIEPSRISRVAHQDRTEPVIRHIATLGLVHGLRYSIYWKKLLATLPLESPHCPALPPDTMPDLAILCVFADLNEGPIG